MKFGYFAKVIRKIFEIFEISRSGASKLYIICSYLKSSKFFLEPLRSHFAKIAHNVAKSKYFSNIKNESYSPLNSLSIDIQFVRVSFVLQNLLVGGGGGAPHHLHLLFCKSVFIGSFSSNVDDSIEKTRNKAGIIFSSHLDRRKVNPLIYVKFWKQACLPSLLFGVELFTLTPALLLKLERCQSWFLKHIFYVPSFTPGPILLNVLNSVASEIAIKKLLFLGRLITEPNIAPKFVSM